MVWNCLHWSRARRKLENSEASLEVRVHTLPKSTASMQECFNMRTLVEALFLRSLFQHDCIRLTWGDRDPFSMQNQTQDGLAKTAMDWSAKPVLVNRRPSFCVTKSA